MLYKDPYVSKDSFENAVLVFDTSSLCRMYEIQDKYKRLLLDIIGRINGKVWFPYQVIAEYEKNRIKAINNPKEEKYRLPEFFTKKGFYKNAVDYLDHLNQMDYQHPFVDEDKLYEMKSLVEDIQQKHRKLKEIMKEQREKRFIEIEYLVEHDIINDFVNKHKHGDGFSFLEQLDLAKEAEFRYRNQIPPGYQDSERYKINLSDKGKYGIDQYGDYFVWMEILRYAKAKSAPIIFITDDTKEDWFESIGEKLFPRKELIEEFKETVNRNFWMYTLNGFIQKIIDFYKAPNMLPLYNGLEDVIYALQNARQESINGDYLLLKCSACGEIFRVYESYLVLFYDDELCSTKDMSPGFDWISKEKQECPVCNNNIVIDIAVWEAPIGTLNNKSINCDGATILKDIKIRNCISYYRNDDDDEDLNDL